MKKEDTLFLLLNILIWVIAWGALTSHDFLWAKRIARFYMPYSYFHYLITGSLLTYLTGFFISCFIYFFLGRFYFRNYEALSIGKMALIVMLFSEIWIWFDYLLTIIHFHYDGDDFNLSLAHYIPHRIKLAFILFSWMGFFLTYKYWREWKNQKLKTEKASALAREARLDLLRYQLNPHFLFNALNSVRALIYKSPPEADRMVSGMSEFMRYSLMNNETRELPLEEEINIVQNYLDIEKIRFGEKLVATINIDPIANEYPIPPFLIIPLVENAVKHGMKTSPAPLNIVIKAEVIDEELVILVKNSGRWPDNDDKDIQAGTGTGLENLKKRLKQMYPGNHLFLIEQGKEAVTARLRIYKKLENEKTEIDYS